MTRRCSIALFPPLLRNRRGIALLYLIILFTLLGVLVIAGSRVLSSTVSRRMVNDTKTVLERDVRMITAWAVRNGRLPDSTEFPAVFGSTPLDAWGKPVVYAYDSNLTASATGGICGRVSTTMSHDGKDVAFLLISGGEDMGVNSTPSGSGAYSGALTSVAAGDLYRIVALNELQSQAGCAAASQGTLRIVNNELPRACEGKTYKTTFFCDGGVPPVNFSYPGLPSWLATTGAHFENLSSGAAPASSSYTINVSATDAAANSVNRSYLLKIDSCPPAP